MNNLIELEIMDLKATKLVDREEKNEELIFDKKNSKGYMTGEEFVKRGKEAISKYYIEHGLL